MRLIQEAESAGARRSACCEIVGLSIRTLERWEKDPEQGDRRAGPLTPPPHTLTELEKKRILELSTSKQFCDLCPWQIVAKLADQGQYIASESSFYRVLKAENLLAHRSKSKPRQPKRPKDLIARKPNQVWSWDITYLKSPIKGMHFYLYMAMDVFSRMIVGWSVELAESPEHGAEMINAACVKQKIQKNQITLHSDNGLPMKGATMLSTLQRLGVMPSFSRPAVSDDNPFSESLFKTLKYRPSYPDGAFADIEEARAWVARFVTWYNTEHLHSGIRFVTPLDRHLGRDEAQLAKRHDVYQKAKNRNPRRWSGPTRNWSQVTEVRLNPPKLLAEDTKELRNRAA